MDPLDGSVNRDLVKALLRLMRPSGERIDITWLLFLDQFLVEGDTSQWQLSSPPTYPTLADVVVEDGLLKFVTANPGHTEFVSCAPDPVTPLAWASYSVYARMKATRSGSPGLNSYGIAFHVATPADFYYAVFNPDSNQILMGQWTDGAPTVAFDLSTIGYILQDDVFYGIRVDVVVSGGTNYIKVYFDGALVGQWTDSDLLVGTVAVFKEPGYTLAVDTVELMRLPSDTDLVDINS
jgi:hypothetical protein